MTVAWLVRVRPVHPLVQVVPAVIGQGSRPLMTAAIHRHQAPIRQRIRGVLVSEVGPNPFGTSLSHPLQDFHLALRQRGVVTAHVLSVARAVSGTGALGGTVAGYPLLVPGSSTLGRPYPSSLLRAAQGQVTLQRPVGAPAEHSVLRLAPRCDRDGCQSSPKYSRE
jgi:hypothetical protein